MSIRVRIPVIFACDESYAMPCGVAATSLLANRGGNTSYDVHILAGHLTSRTRDRLCSLTDGFSRVRIVSCASIMNEDYRALVAGHAYLSEAAFLRFHAAELLPDLERALYLDADVVVQTDLADLFRTNLGTAYAAAVRALTVLELSRGVKNPVADPYFNSGVLLLDLTRMRRENLGQRLRDDMVRNRYPCHDQDALNHVYGGSVRWLSPTYNYCSTYDILCTSREAAEHFRISRPDWRAIQRFPSIIHYIYDKPWHYRYALRAAVWRRYFAASPFRNDQFQYRASARVFVTGLLAHVLPDRARQTVRDAYVRSHYPASD